MKTSTGLRAAIYTRISEDRFGEGEGVERQREDCEKLAANRGLDVVALYEDNNKSAMHGKRPRYEDLCAAVTAGEIDVVIVWKTDRLYRRLKELIELTEVFREVPVYSVQSGDVDLSTADGRMVAHMLGSVSQHESEVKSERISAAAKQRVAKGRFNGGNRRFGYEHSGTRTVIVHGADAREVEVPTGPLVLVPAEADAIKWGVEHFLAGGSLRSICREWTARGLAGTWGAEFTSLTVRRILDRPMNAGLATYKGQTLEAVHDAPAIITVDQWKEVCSMLDSPGRRPTGGKPATSLLSPILKCAVCIERGAKVAYVSASQHAGRRGETVRVYRCKNGHVERRREGLDIAISAIFWTYLNLHADKLTRAVATDKKVSKTEAKLDALLAKRESWRARASDISNVEDYIAVLNSIDADIKALEKTGVATRERPATMTLLRSADMHATWESMDTAARRAVIREVFPVIMVGKGKVGGDAAKNYALVNIQIFDYTDAVIFDGEIGNGSRGAIYEAAAATTTPMTDEVAKRVSAAMFPS